MVVIAEQTERSPRIVLDGKILSISGRSYMSDAVGYYKVIFNNITDLDLSGITVEVCMEYFNTSSSKCLLELFKLVSRKANGGEEVNVVWKYKSPEMLEAGEDYRDLLEDVKFELQKV